MSARPEKRSIGLLRDICADRERVDLAVLEEVLVLGVEIAREGREGRKVGTLFTVFDEREVLSRSTSLILDPLAGHSDSSKRISDANLRETVKELAQLDGAFVVADSGVVVSACRYINASSEGIQLPLGLGSQHMAAASITRTTGAVAVVVSESSIVRVFDEGELVTEIIPELWLLSRHQLHLAEPYSLRSGENLTVAKRDAECGALPQRRPSGGTGQPSSPPPHVRKARRALSISRRRHVGRSA